MKRAKWQHWKHPKTGKWDGHSYKSKNVLFISRQGYNREFDCLNAIEASSGSRESERVEFRGRFKSKK